MDQAGGGHCRAVEADQVGGAALFELNFRYGIRPGSPFQTASFAALTGRALIIFRAGLALNTVGSLVNGLMPLRSFVAGFLMTTNFAKPGSRKAPVFLSSL